MQRSRSSHDSGEQFGPYQVLERIGIGGMATVHRARERGIAGFERIVALKRLLPHLAEDEKFVRAFVREAKLASLLQHANIVQLYDLGRVGHLYFISMELVEGRDVRQILRHARKVCSPPPIGVTVALVSQICDALDYAHMRVDETGQPVGLVHRDVSPSNVLVSNSGYAKVIDFGIAKANSVHLRTQTGRVKGKIAYMSPEAIRGYDLDGRSDLFSAGVLAHELLVAKPLFASNSDYKTLVRVQKAAITPPSAFNPHCPPELDAIVLKALERDRDLRWPSAAEMRDALAVLAHQYTLAASHVEVARWLREAFASSAEAGSSEDATGSRSIIRTTGRSPSASESDAAPEPYSGSEADITPTTQPSRLPGITGAYFPAPREEDDIAEIAWGGRSRENHVLLDDVPDVAACAAHPHPPGPTMAEAARQTSDFAALVVPGQGPPTTPPLWQPRAWARGSRPSRVLDRSSRLGWTAAPGAAGGATGPWPRQRWRRLAMAGVGVVLLAVLFITAKRSGTAGTEATRAAAELGVVNIHGEPADATIAVNGKAKKGAPQRIRLKAGHYTIQISHQGYETRLVSADVVAGKSQLLRYHLDPKVSGWFDDLNRRSYLAKLAEGRGRQQATVAIKTDRGGYAVSLDGNIVEGTTPTTLQVAPGSHLVAVLGPKGQLWSHRFEARPNSHYEFHPAVAERPSQGDSEPAKPVSNSVAAAKPEDSVAAAKPEATTAESSSTSAAPPAPASAATELQPPPPAASGAEHSARSTGGHEPAIVPSHTVRKRSGSVPEIRLRPGEEYPERIVAKLCIDELGHVSSARILNEVGDRLQRILLWSLKRWQYEPIVRAGEPVPVCFSVAIALTQRD